MKRVLFLLPLILAGCGSKAPPPAPKKVPVKVAKVETKTVPYYISTQGHMEAYQTVDIMAQVTGYLDKIHFQEGDYVKKGDLLFTIDKRPFVAEVEKARAELEQNIASLRFAEITAERNAPLVENDYISKNSYDNLVTNVLTGGAAVQESQANLETALINLGYCEIRAPMDARAGEYLLYDGGLVVETSETNLVTLTQVSPIYCTFFIPGRDLPRVQAHQRAQGELKVQINVEGDEKTPYDGTLSFIDNEIDLSTGMLKMKATLPNKERNLWPNQYSHVMIVLDQIENAHLVPNEAVQESPKTKYVYVIRGGKAKMVPVKVGQIHGNSIVIESGLTGGETVVIEGQINLSNGSEVRILQ